MTTEGNAAEVEIFQTFELSDGSRSVTILATKEEEERINQDQHYATERFLSALDECGAEDEEGGDFTHSSTLLLIECIKDRFEKFCSSRYWRNRVYKDVQKELGMYSYNFSIEKIRSKWSNLVTTYKRIKCRHKSSGAARRVWEYYQPLDDLLGPSFESSAPTRVSVTTAKPHSTHIVQQQSPASNSLSCITPEPSEEPSTSPPAASSPTWPQASIRKPSGASGSQTKRKHDGTPSNFDYKLERGDKREEMLEIFLQQINEKEIREYNYKKRKERRDRLKLKALQKIVCKLEAITKIQEDILKKQDSLLETIHQSVSTP